MNPLQCELCGHKGNWTSVYPKKAIVKCPNCQLVFYDKKIDAASLYTEDYFKGGEYADYLADKEIIQRNFGCRIKQLRKYKDGGRLLEIGSAYGLFMEMAQPFWQVTGVEISSECAEYARNNLGLDVKTADFLSLQDEFESYDIICMWDTVEHLAHPVRYIEKASRWLKPGGLLFLTTGDIDSRMSRFRKDKWRLIHPPTHLYYFSKNTLTRSANKAELEVINISHVGFSRSFRAILYGLFVAREKKYSWLYRLLTINGKIDLPIYLNFYDIMMLVAKKNHKKNKRILSK